MTLDIYLNIAKISQQEESKELIPDSSLLILVIRLLY